MKKIKAKKLTLNKTSIAQLDNFQQNQIKGGMRRQTEETLCGQECSTGNICVL